MDKKEFINMLKELFEEGVIKINVEQYDEWEDKRQKVEVIIDGDIVYSDDNKIGSSGWTDY